jgi:hypothetical protein
MRNKWRQISGKGLNKANDVDQWLQLSGFAFNPFSALDAASDQYLHRYLVQNEAHAAIWGDTTALIFEPRGGGKTALRLGIVQDCYIGQESTLPFPISYVPPFLQWGHISPSAEDHLKALLRFGALQLLISLVYRPHWFLDLPLHHRRLIRMYLDIDLPGPLMGYLTELTTLEDLDHLWRRTGFSPFIRSEPDLESLNSLLDALSATVAAPKASSPIERWQLVQELLLSVLSMDGIYILVDGLDGAPETASDPDVLLNVCDYLWQNGLVWAQDKVFIKAFLPNEVKDTMECRYPTWFRHANIANIHWTEDLLVSMLEARIKAATEGELQSFDILAAPDFASVERQIVAASPHPLPRDVLLLTSELLSCHLRRCKQYGQRLEEQDLLAAVQSFVSYV